MSSANGMNAARVNQAAKPELLFYECFEPETGRIVGVGNAPKN